MNKSLNFKRIIFFLFFFKVVLITHSQVDNAPIVTAKGRQVFCPGNSIKIVTDFTITDSDDITIESFFIQISKGYQVNFDRLQLSGNHPKILPLWNNTEGKLTLISSISGTEILLTDLEMAIKDIIFSTSATSIEVEKTFSLTIDNTNFLPLTGHFYEFISVPNIKWTDAKIAAENKTFYGRKGYLATLTSQEESNFAGKQASGAGWIGGSDEETEGVWKWVTGPEAGLIFWNGAVSGTTPNFAFWNNSEPNDFKGNNPIGEDYAHITDPNVNNVIIGSWNDLPNAGGTGLYIPKGYIVEYGSPGDPPLNIAASTSIYLPQITSANSTAVCVSGKSTLTAVATDGVIEWYDSPVGGTLLHSGGTYITKDLSINTSFYVTISTNRCSNFPRTEVTVDVLQKPTIMSTTDDLICSGSAILTAIASEGDVYWFESRTAMMPMHIGTAIKTGTLVASKSYFVEANNRGCISNNRVEVKAIVDSRIPQFDVAQNTYTLCKDIGQLTLETINQKDNYTYMWFKNGSLLQGNLSKISIKNSGIYKVKAFSKAGCESLEQRITVISSEIATISSNDVVIKDDDNNNSIEVITSNFGIGDYEFSLDNKSGPYSNQKKFENLTIGQHTLYINDKNNCGTSEFNFSILSFPVFFTPNGDGKNDMWKIKGFNNVLFTVLDVNIYDRFGVLLHRINPSIGGWNGFSKGKLMPPNTYWYKATLIDINGREIQKTGSISLIR